MRVESDAEDSDGVDDEGFFKDLEHIKDVTRKEPSDKVLDLNKLFGTPFESKPGKLRRVCLTCK